MTLTGVIMRLPRTDGRLDRAETDSVDDSRGLLERLVRVADEFEELLWLFVLVVLTADIILTYQGLRHGLTEANPIMHHAFEGVGFAMLGLTKAVVLGFAGVARELLPERGPVIPVGLGIPWFAAVVVNVVMLAPVL